MYQRILLTMDGSPLSEVAIPHALALGKAFSAHVTLLSIVEPIVIAQQPGVAGPMVSIAVGAEDGMDDMREYLRGVADRFKNEQLETGVVVREGAPASEICDYAKEQNIDLIIMSTHGRSGLQRWVYGSVADKVLRGADVPVLLIRSSRAE